MSRTCHSAVNGPKLPDKSSSRSGRESEIRLYSSHGPYTENHLFGIRVHLALHSYRNCFLGKPWPPSVLVALKHGYISKQRFIYRIAHWYPLIHGTPFLFDLIFPSALHCCIDVHPALSLTEASEVALVQKSSLCRSSFDSVNVVLSAKPRQYPGIKIAITDVFG
jgi:hypothetical protein